MKKTGIIRRLDDLGRIVIPREIRRSLFLHEGDPMELCLTEKGNIILQKYSQSGAIERELRTGLTVLRAQFPSVRFTALDKFAVPITNDRRISDEETQLVRTAAETRSKQTNSTADGCCLAAVPIVVEGETWAVVLAMSSKLESSSEFRHAEETLHVLCKYIAGMCSL